MNADAQELDRLVREWWVTESGDELFPLILDLAVGSEPRSLVPFARAVQILNMQQLRPAIQQRVDELRVQLETLRTRQLQIDALGDGNNDPQALFEVLSKDVRELQGFDLESLKRARLSHQESHGRAALAFLETLGWHRLPSEVASALKQAVDEIIEREQQQAWGLFVAPGVSQGIALGLKLVLNDSGQGFSSDADKDIREQANIAARLALQGKAWDAKLEWPASFVGESIGLPFYVAALVARSVVPSHALTASTGRLDIDGRVTGVSGMKEKIEAARRIGMRRVLVPGENLNEAKTAAGKDLIVLAIDHIREVTGALRQPLSPIELGYSGLILLIRASISDYQLAIDDEVESSQGFRFVVANASGKAQVWVYKNNNVRAEGAAGPALDAAKRLVAERVPGDPEQRGALTFHLPTRHLQDEYHTALHDLGAVDDTPHQYETWRTLLSRGRSRATIVLYNSGKCVIQGQAPAWDAARDQADSITANLGGLPSNRPAASMPAAKASPEETSEPHIGTDEAGKGDYFGPLVCAAVFVDRESAARLRQLGVRDSKTLSDRRIRELAEEIRRMPEVRHAVTAINPRKFNELYERFRREGKNLNSLLAWGHARSIDTLLNAPGSKRLDAKYVLVDQFADKHYIEERTRRAGIPVHQRPKAEEDIAVAAASVLAREGFVRWLDRWSERTQILLPKGASPQVIEAAKQFVKKWGAKWLGEVAKLNFRTTAQVLEGEEKSASHGTPQWISEQSEPKSEG